MKIGYFQKTISSLSLAVLTGVVLFSVGSGTSATPEYSPPGTGVKPTFYGTKMLGAIENPNGDVVVDGNFQVKKIPGSDLDKGTLTVDGGVYLNNAGGGGINLGSTDGTSKIYVRGALDFLTTDTTKNVINNLLKIISHDTVNGLVFQAPGVRITLSPNKGVAITNEASLGASNGSKDLKGEMNVTVQGNLDLTGKIKDTVGDGTINVENHLDVLGTVFAMTVDTGDIKNGTIDDGGWVTVDDKFAVTQNSNFKGNVVIENTLSVWDAATSLNGLIKTNKVQSGSIETASIETASLENKGTSNEGAVQVNDDLKLNGNILLGIKAIGLGATSEGFIQQGSQLTIASMPNTDIELIAGASRIWMKKAGTVEVQGKLVATKGVGTIAAYGSGWKSFSPGAGWKNFDYSYACPTGYIAIACNYNDKNSDHDNFNVLNLYNSGSSCYINFDAKKDNNGNNPQLRLHNSCWNPSI